MSPRYARQTRPSFLAIVMLALLVACQDAAAPSLNQPPTAAFVATTTAGPSPLTVDFDATASSDPDGTIVGFVWAFGDGASGTGVTTRHTYLEPGSYTARLTVSDDRGATSSAVIDITVTAGSTSTGVAGTITAGATTPLASRQAVARHASAAGTAAGAADIVPGELIVRFAGDLGARALTPLVVDGVELAAVRPLSLPSTQLYRNPGLSRAETLALARRMEARADVAYAHPNYILQTLAVPNDEFFSFQWHYPAINLPAAWDITTGSPDIVVAVGDTGILHSATNPSATHPDFAGKVLPGYDFIANPEVAGDGDGRDPDAYDVGDDPGGQSSYHGSHVAGTVAAATNNGVGVAGVDWQAKILPIRMLGRGGGSLVDIVEGTLWAAGFSVSGVPTNPNPAHVINLSLGGAYTCTPFEQEAFDRIATASPRNAVVVVAAGNENQNAAGFSPASCANVITVGATEFRDHRAPYSNFGSRIDVMAPGGDITADRNGDGFPDGVLSVYNFDGADGGFFYEFQNGTSMAAPHVAGVVALMKSLDPALGLQDALALLQATARPLTAGACERPTASDCGAGLIDAAAALTMLQAGTIPTPGGGALAFSPNPLDFGVDREVLTITLTNTGASSASWALSAFDPSADNPGEMQDGSVFLTDGAATSGVLSSGASTTTSIGVDRSRVSADGAYQFDLLFAVDGSEQALTVRFRAGGSGNPTPQGPTIVAAFIDDGAGELVLSGFQEADAFFTNYGFSVLAGENLVIAWSDENGNADIDDGDYIGVYPALVAVAPGANVTGLDFVVERVIGLDTLVAPPGGWDLDRESWTRMIARLIELR